jgi:hypothetical protein
VVVHRIIGKNRINQQIIFRHRGDAGACSGITTEKAVIGIVTSINNGDNTVRLDSRRHALGNRVLGWRLRLIDSFSRMQPRALGVVLHLALRPLGRLCRHFLPRLS